MCRGFWFPRGTDSLAFVGGGHRAVWPVRVVGVGCSFPPCCVAGGSPFCNEIVMFRYVMHISFRYVSL